VGLLDRFRKSSSASVPVELEPDAIRDADECHRAGRDVGRATRGRGSAQLLTVAGTSHRQPAVEAVVAGRGGPSTVTEANLPAVLFPDPTNAHDRNAIRVLVDGVHIGFVPASEAPRFQPLLAECERRNVLLIGSVRITGDADRGWGAGLQVRPNLDGWESPVAKKPAAKRRPAPAASAALLLEGDDLASAVQALRRLVEQEPVRTKQRAGLVEKQVRELLPALEAHSAALEALDEQRGIVFADDLSVVESAVGDLHDAEDAEEREDAHMDLQSVLEDVLAVLTR
jgi:hypothetical protein